MAILCEQRIGAARITSLLNAMRIGNRQNDGRGPPADPARLRSCGGPSAGAWLTAILTSDMFRLDDKEFACALRRRLGLGVTAIDLQCEGCGADLDPFGHHRCACGRTGRNHARHRGAMAAWRQVFQESGHPIPQRNVERLLRNTHIPTARDTERRLDLIVGNTSVARGLPLFCDVTVISPVTGRGRARPSATTINGGVLNNARRQNNRNYAEVISSGLGCLCALDTEVYGRWGTDPLWLIPALARERSRGLPVRIRRGTQMRLQTRWWAILAVGVQRLVAHACLRTYGADITNGIGEHPLSIADLPSDP